MREQDGPVPAACVLRHPAPASRDARAALVAARQYGVLTQGQLRSAGISRSAVSRRVASGRLQRLHRGVYAFGVASGSLHATALAAVLACGPGAILSHHSAALLWGVLDAAVGPHEVIVPGRHRTGDATLRVHRAPTLAAADRTTRAGIPVTRPARTLVDLGAVLDPRALERVLDEILVRRLARPVDISGALRRAGRVRGGAVLAALLTRHVGPTLTRSEAEEVLLALVRDADLPAPRINVRVHGVEVDLLWAAERVVVEMDGFAYHGGRAAFERDRARDARLQAAGYAIIRVTWRQLDRAPASTLAQLALLLGRRAA